MAHAHSMTGDEFFERRPMGRELISGARAGQLAGVTMTIAMMGLFSLFTHATPFLPIEVIAGSVLGEHAIGPVRPDTIAVGVLVHQLGPALVWGFVFGALVWIFEPRRGIALMMLGLLLGVLAELVDVYVVMPYLAEQSGHLGALEPLSQASRLWGSYIPAPVSWIGHLVFGAALSFHPWRYDPLARAYD